MARKAMFHMVLLFSATSALMTATTVNHEEMAAVVRQRKLALRGVEQQPNNTTAESLLLGALLKTEEHATKGGELWLDECVAKQNQWARMPNAKYVHLQSCPLCGLGNRMLCTASAFFLACLTNRVLVSDIPAVETVLFDPQLTSLYDPDLSKILTKSRSIKTITHSDVLCHDLRNVNETVLLAKLDTLSNGYFLKALLVNMHYSTSLLNYSRDLVDGDKLFENIFARIFRPSAVIREMLDFALQTPGFEHGCRLGIHDRGVWEHWGRCSNHSDSEVGMAEKHDAIRSCAGHIADKEVHSGIVYVTAVDPLCVTMWRHAFNKERIYAMEDVTAHFPEPMRKTLATFGGKPGLHNGHLSKATGFLDMLLAASCNQLLGSPHSTFTYAIAGSRSTKPWYLLNENTSAPGNGPVAQVQSDYGTRIKQANDMVCFQPLDSQPCYKNFIHVKQKLKSYWSHVECYKKSTTTPMAMSVLATEREQPWC
jgi:hypothetical protein